MDDWFEFFSFNTNGVFITSFFATDTSFRVLFGRHPEYFKSVFSYPEKRPVSVLALDKPYYSSKRKMYLGDDKNGLTPRTLDDLLLAGIAFDLVSECNISPGYIRIDRDRNCLSIMDRELVFFDSSVNQDDSVLPKDKVVWCLPGNENRLVQRKLHPAVPRSLDKWRTRNTVTRFFDNVLFKVITQHKNQFKKIDMPRDRCFPKSINDCHEEPLMYPERDEMLTAIQKLEADMELLFSDRKIPKMYVFGVYKKKE